jgi:hypothetical protein
VDTSIAGGLGADAHTADACVIAATSRRVVRHRDALMRTRFVEAGQPISRQRLPRRGVRGVLVVTGSDHWILVERAKPHGDDIRVNRTLALQRGSARTAEHLWSTSERRPGP